MMIHAYQEMYLSKAQAVLGDTFDFAINTCGIAGQIFADMFVASSFSKRFENGEPEVIAGRSGVEIAVDIIHEISDHQLELTADKSYDRSREYWIGWAVSYYQWYSSRTYREIFTAMTFDDLQKMYSTLHEADITKFSEIADKRVREAFMETN